jgi:hypothetical protein
VLSYVASYADLLQAIGTNIAAGRTHYEDFGAKEGRKITFEALSYIASHGDLIGAFGIDAAAGAKHFIEYGYKEGRRVSFDPSVYLSLHADLRSAFGSDTAAATRHYIQFGFKEGRAIVGQPLIQISPSSIDFGNVTQGSVSASRTVLVANVGAAPLTVAGISVTGSGATQFSQSSNCSSVAAGGSCTISVTFTPTSTGSKSASISIAHNASGSPSAINLSGTGAAAPTPAISVNPTSLSFSQTVNTTSSAQTVTVSNTGNATLTVSGVSLTGADAGQFSQTNTCSSVAAGGSCTISVTFTPTSTGSKSASISIAHNASGSPSAINLSGTGAAAPTPAISVNPTSLSFSQTVNTTSSAQTVTVSNTGNATLTVSGVSLTGADAGQFSQTNTCSSVAAGGSCTISVTFTPTSTGSKSASISIAHNASGSPDRLILSGDAICTRGSSSSTAVSSAQELLQVCPGISSGWYWFTAQSLGGPGRPFQVYMDQQTNGGGWIQVRRIPGIGGWFSANDDLRGTEAISSPDLTFNKSSEWSIIFDYLTNSNSEFLFATGDYSAWCVLKRGGTNPNTSGGYFSGVESVDTLATTVIASFGTAIPAGGKTNVLLRSQPEDPWIGCEGTHWLNGNRMLYGESGNSLYSAFKNSRNGINVFVRGGALPSGVSSVLNLDLIPEASSSARVFTGGSAVANLTISKSVDSLTGSVYAMGYDAFSEEEVSQKWRLDYLSSNSATFASRNLPRTARVIWRTSDGRGRPLPTSGWTRVCFDRIWAVQDGYQLLFHVGDRPLIDLSSGQVSVKPVAEATLITDVRCSDERGLWIEGFSFGVSDNEPLLRIQSVPATRFSFSLDRYGVITKRDVNPAQFDILGLCEAPANEQKRFCSEARKAVGW